MTRPLSNDLRERVVGAIEAGESCRSVAARFGIAVSSGCGRLKSEPSRRHGNTSAASSPQFNPTNAATTSPMPDMLPLKPETL